MSISEPVNGYDKLSDRGIVRIMLVILLAGLMVFAAIAVGGALGIVPNACAGPDQHIMHARCEDPTRLSYQPPFLEFYPAYTSTTNFSNTAPLPPVSSLAPVNVDCSKTEYIGNPGLTKLVYIPECSNQAVLIYGINDIDSIYEAPVSK
jgi:hypothetical protein